MKLLPGKLFCRFASKSATIDKVTISGVDLIVDGSYHLEVNAQSICEVAYSGIDGITTGMKLGISYHVVFQNELQPDQSRKYHNLYEIDGEKLWLVKDSCIFCIIDGDKYIAYGENCLVKPKYAPSTGLIGDFELTRNGCRVIKERGYYVSGNIPECQEGDEVVFPWSVRGETDFGYKNTFYIMPSRYLQVNLHGGSKGR